MKQGLKIKIDSCDLGIGIYLGFIGWDLEF